MRKYTQVELEEAVKGQQLSIMSEITVVDDDDNPTTFCVIKTNRLIDIERIWALLKEQSWWKDAVIERFITAVMNSQCFCLMKKIEVNKLLGGKSYQYENIGFARVISDNTTYHIFDDFIIEHEYRGLGLGRWMFEFCHEHPDFDTVRNRFLWTCEKSRSLYTEKGYDELIHDLHLDKFLVLIDRESYKDDEKRLMEVRGE